MSLPQVGVDFAGYRLLAVVARGGMSVVYHAENPRLGNLVALKVLAPELASDDVFRARFLQESRVAASLNHPHVIPIYDAGPCDGLLYIAMRFVTGADLRTVLKHRERLAPAQALLLLGQTGRALDAAHRQGLVHRDVKPANILIERGADEDDPDHAYLADFGITKHALSRSGLTATGQFVGTIDYIAPEQIQDKPVDGRADIYSLGCVLYECLTGRVPFLKNLDAAVIWAHVEEMPTLPSAVCSDLPRGIDDVIERAVAKDPNDRYDTCRELIAAARTALESRSARSHQRGAPVGPEPEAETVLSAPGGAGPQAPLGDPGVGDGAWLGLRTGAPAPQRPGAASGPAATGARRAPERELGADRRPARGARRWRPVAIVGVTLVGLAAIAVAVVSSLGGSDGSPRRARAGPRQVNPLLQAVRGLDTSPTSRGRLPVATCMAHSSSLVTCAHPAPAVGAVTLRTFKSLPALYAAYTDSLKSLGDGPGPRTNFGDCLPNRTYGEVSWNHDYRHPKMYSLKQATSGNVMENDAAGRVFCTFHGSNFYIVWTMNDGRLLGMLSGAPHDEAWRWWRAVHHDLTIPGSSAHMGSNSGMDVGSAMSSKAQ